MGDTDRPSRQAVPPSVALYDLALEFSDRAQQAEAALLAAFTARASALMPGIGPILLDDDDDERLELRADGLFAGAVLDEDSDDWIGIDTPEEVVRYYDPTDVFLDLADAIAERFPEVDDERGADGAVDTVRATAVPTPADGEPAPIVASRDGGTAPAEPTESATLTMLRDLRRSGALSDADFERLRSDLHLRD